jgi:ATP-dependent RNA helicase DHX33
LPEVPQYLFEAGISGEGMIAITQPRRVAATSLAARVAKEQGIKLGTRVGYSVRFDEKCSDETRIKYLTDGMMMRELMSDPLLLRYSVVIVDEAHERTIRSDLLLASLKEIQKRRNGDKSIRRLRIVIMSATLDAEKFSKFFDGYILSCYYTEPHLIRGLVPKFSI